MVASRACVDSKPDDGKFRELILYLADKSQADPKFGSTKLNKLLFFCDFLAYKSLGRSITGHEYQKLPHGPAPRALLPVRELMVEEGDCILREEDHFGYDQQRLIPLRAPRPEVFSGAEIDLIRDVISELWNSNGSEVSDLSHQFLGWELAAVGEPIPYMSILVSAPNPLNEEQEAWAKEIVEGYLEEDQVPTQV